MKNNFIPERLNHNFKVKKSVMKNHIKLLVICIVFVSACSNNRFENPYFDEYKMQFRILIPPFFTGNMNIKNDKSFIITYVSPGDTINKSKAVNDTVVGKISDLEMTKLVELCKRADVYNVNFLSNAKGVTLYIINDYLFEINIKDKNGRTNKLSYSSGNIPKESADLQNYSEALMNTYYKWR